MDFEFDSVLEALAVKKRDYALAEEKIKIRKRKLYPLYRNYPNGSKQYYDRLADEEEKEYFEQEFIERIGFLETLKKNIKKVKSECAKEFKALFEGFTKNPYF